MGGTDVQKTCDQIVMKDLVVERLGSEIPGKFIEDLYARAKERMKGDGGQYMGLKMVSLVYDKRLKYITLGFFGFGRGGVFSVPYGKAVRRGRIDALCKIFCAKGAEIKKMPPLQPWPLTVQKEFVIYTYSFPYECELCNILRFARLHQLGLHDH